MLKKLIQKLKSKKRVNPTKQETKDVYEQNIKEVNDSIVTSYQKFAQDRDNGISLEEMLNAPAQDSVSKNLSDGYLVWFETIYQSSKPKDNTI